MNMKIQYAYKRKSIDINTHWNSYYLNWYIQSVKKCSRNQLFHIQQEKIKCRSRYKNWNGLLFIFKIEIILTFL